MRHVGKPFPDIINRWYFISPEDGAVTQLYLGTSPEIEEKNIKAKYFIPYGQEYTPLKAATTEENQTELWEFTEMILHEKVPGYTGAGI